VSAAAPTRRVDEPRPTAAWAMAGIAAATLWITGQIAPWAVAVEALTLVVSFLRRLQPRDWQRNPWLLNAGMAAISGSTIALALQGAPSTISLAHFAGLTQGLQLIDARPRKTEFLLVALALFQVILAANLTDSVFYPLMLAGFLIATTWTLLVHTLRAEALEAGDRRAARAALTPGLWRVTWIASLCSVGLAMVLFVAMPRMRSNWIAGGVQQSQAVAGFNDEVRLGTIGRIRQDRTVVLRVETLRGDAPPREAAYWRGLAFDTFDGERWSITPNLRSAPGGTPKFGIPLGPLAEQAPLVQTIVREPVQAGVLFGVGARHYLEGALDRVEMDPNGGLYAPVQADERVRYTIATDPRPPGDGALAGDEAAPPRRIGDRFTALPEMSPEVAALARRITADADGDAGRARAIEHWLRREGRYTDLPPEVPEGREKHAVEQFLLGELAGHCEYFASSMVVLARSVGLPSRLVNGFAGGRRNALGGFTEIARSDAHAWVEVHFRDHGWVRYDPTPPTLRMPAETPLDWAGRMAAVGSAIELWWFQRVVDFDSSDQIAALKSAWGAWHALRPSKPDGDAERPRRPGFQPDGSLLLPVLAGLAITALVGAVVAALRGWRRGAAAPPALPEYRSALRLLARAGLRRAPTSTARGFVAECGTRLSGEARAALSALTELYLAHRFGAARGGDAEARRQLDALRRGLRAAARRRRGRAGAQSAP